MRTLVLVLVAVAVVVVSGCFDGTVTTALPVACLGGDDCPAELVCLQSRCVAADGSCLVVDGREARLQPDGNACADGDRICVDGDCVVPRCGDGVTTGSETCDGSEGCRADCTFCGDRRQNGDEACDDGDDNADVADACRPGCVAPSCGDGITDSGEACDDGADNSDVVPGACRTDCAPFDCGDSVTDTFEQCDDGDDNALAPDACRPTCVTAACGDGVVDSGEACDDGAANSDVRPNACRRDCVLPRCGDAIRDAEEECDEGGANDDTAADACRLDCVRAGCGDGVVDSVEACDDGNTASADGCRGDCGKAEVCGDGVTDDGEGCDDGNANPVDGCAACVVMGWSREVLVRGSVEGSTGEAVFLSRPSTVAIDRLGRIFIADSFAHRIRRLDPDGTTTVIAGTGEPGFAGDGLPAPNARLNNPIGVAVDTRGNVFVSDAGNRRVRRIDATGLISTIAGSGVAGFSGDGGLATQARLALPAGLAVDADGRVYIADALNHRVRVVDGLLIRTLAGNGVAAFAGDGGAPTSASLQQPSAVAVRADGSALFIGDTLNHRVRLVTLAAPATISTFAGDGVAGFSGDGGPAQDAQLNEPVGVSLDALGRLLIGDATNNCVRRVDDAGVITTVAGTGGVAGFSGDGGPATLATFNTTFDVVDDRQGGLLIIDAFNNRLRRVNAAGVISTIAGGAGLDDDGLAATATPLRDLSGVAVDSSGALYFNDGTHRVRRIEPDGTVTTVAGNGTEGFSGDGGPGVDAAFDFPGGMAVAPDGALLITDSANNRLRRLAPDGTITTVVGTGVRASTGDGGPATLAAINQPLGVAIDVDGAVLIAECRGNRVRRVGTNGVITTVAGTGTRGFSGDGGDATLATLACPLSAIDDGSGAVLIADAINQRVRRVDIDGVITTVAGTGAIGFTGDAGPANQARLSEPSALFPDGEGGYVIADRNNGRIRHVDGLGTITTIAGNGSLVFAGDGGPATAAGAEPTDVVIDGDGVLFFPDSQNGFVRRVDLSGTISTVAGAIHPPGPGPLGRSALYGPRHLAMVADLILSSGDQRRVVAVDRTRQRVDVVVGYPSASPVVQGLAAFAPLLNRAGGMVFDEAAGLLWVIDESGPGLRRIDVDADDDDVIDGPSSWTASSLPLPADGGFSAPSGTAFEPDRGTIVVADRLEHCVRRFDPAGVLPTETVLGECGTRGSFAGLLDGPGHVARAPGGTLYVSDEGNHQVLRVGTDGSVTTVIGDGSRSSAGDGAPANRFPVDTPGQLAVDAHGNLFVASSTTVRLVANVDGDDDADGDDTVITIYGSGPRQAFPESSSLCLTGLALVGDTVVVADACQGFLLELGPRAVDASLP